jgi:hypothetical protein
VDPYPRHPCQNARAIEQGGETIEDMGDKAKEDTER